jgi:hypothetical protein
MKSRQHHENGVKHKIAVQQFHKEKREKSLHGLKSEDELKKTLQDIDKAAKEAFRSDQTTNHGMENVNCDCI